MMDCISVENMQASDKLTIDRYVPSLELKYPSALPTAVVTADGRQYFPAPEWLSMNPIISLGE